MGLITTEERIHLLIYPSLHFPNRVMPIKLSAVLALQ
jgi:hypothetical protein